MIAVAVSSAVVVGAVGALCAPAVAGAAAWCEAVRDGDAAAVRALLERKADVNAPEVDGTTALHWAVRADDAETVALLIRAGREGERGEPLRRDAASLAARQRQRRRSSRRW